MIFTSQTIVGPRCTGWIVAWMSNELVERLPQWPRFHVLAGQTLAVSIDPHGGRFGLRCSTNVEKLRIAALIEPDEQVPDKRTELILAFPPFQVVR